MMTSTWIFKIQSDYMLSHCASVWAVPPQGGMVGRAIECDWVLADNSRFISRQHAKVDVANDHCYWTDLGTNSTQINGKPMSHSQRTLLRHGDVLKLGEYAIVVEKGPGSWLAQEVDHFDFLAPKLEPEIHIDDLLNDSAPAQVADLSADPIQIPVLAQRMYVGAQQKPAAVQSSNVVSIDHGALQEELETTKQLLRICVQGYMQLLQARRLFKSELGGDYTSLSGKGNNPLKFSKTVEEAIALLTAETSPGYLSAEQSLKQASQDLLAHMQLSISQVQQVIEQVQTTLNPELLSDELQQQGGFNFKIASARKARLWDLYCERYQSLGDLWN